MSRRCPAGPGGVDGAAMGLLRGCYDPSRGQGTNMARRLGARCDLDIVRSQLYKRQNRGVGNDTTELQRKPTSDAHERQPTNAGGPLLPFVAPGRALTVPGPLLPCHFPVSRTEAPMSNGNYQVGSEVHAATRDKSIMGMSISGSRRVYLKYLDGSDQGAVCAPGGRAGDYTSRVVYRLPGDFDEMDNELPTRWSSRMLVDPT